MPIYNIPSTANFVETLARKLLQDYAENHLSLADVLVLLPNRRACRSLSEAFVRLHGMEPTLLPQMRAIGDVYEDEMLFYAPDIIDKFLKIPAVISPQERTLLLMKLIIKRPREFGLTNISLAQSCLLAQELGNLLDKASMQRLSWSRLEEIVPEEYAAHWQETLKLLAIITRYWPDILAERQVIDLQTRRDILMNQQSELWQHNPPAQRIIIAGTTAVSPTMKKLVKTVLHLPQGDIYLAGLDKLLDDNAWQQIDEAHPQFEIKALLEYLQIDRSEVADLISPPLLPRERLISEIMRPSACSDVWRNSTVKLPYESIENVHLLETANLREEALAISVLMRQTLNSSKQTIALVTPERTLARRVAAELKRWNIVVDDSAGIPLAQTPWGIFMRLCAEVCINPDNKENLLALLKHRLFTFPDNDNFEASPAFRIDKNIFREQITDETAQQLLDDIKGLICHNDLHNSRLTPFSHLLEEHIRLAESLSSKNKNNELCLYSDDDGQAGADFIASLLASADILDSVNPNEYLEFFETMMRGVMVHSSHLSHPRIKILGPLEARLNHYDIIIIGGCNEGIWPPSPAADPWLSRPMKRDFGLSLPEQQIGVMALDFANLLGAKEVYLTRSQMNDGTQTVKSRWLMRLITVLKANALRLDSINSPQFLKWGKLLETPSSNIKITPPEPHPPVSARPKKLSASAFEKLLRDPYSIFAEYILRLKPLGELNQELNASDFGNIVHTILDNFAKSYPEKLPDNAAQILYQMGQKAFNEPQIGADKIAFWLPRFYKMVNRLLEIEKGYRQEVAHIYSEVWGHLYFPDTPMGNFEIYARADRIDRTQTQKYNIIDYKTGRARTAKEVYGGYAPQLPIEALIAASGGFEGLNSAPIEQIMYWRLGDKPIIFKDEINQLLERTQAQILKIINLFSFKETGYLSRPNPKHLPEYSDYEHLSRVKEWSVEATGESDD